MECQATSIHVCRLCFHQLRRRWGCVSFFSILPNNFNRKQASRRQPTPLDATLLQILVPGHMRQQDSRTRERMHAALTTPGNSYSRSFDSLLSLLHCRQPKDMLRRWWDLNLKTEFFAHKSTARLMRKAGFGNSGS